MVRLIDQALFSESGEAVELKAAVKGGFEGALHKLRLCHASNSSCTARNHAAPRIHAPVPLPDRVLGWRALIRAKSGAVTETRG